jgi:hypothetical protein
MDLLPKTQQQQTNLDTMVQEENNQIPEHHRKRVKLMDTRPVEIDDDEDEDGAERKVFLFSLFFM